MEKDEQGRKATLGQKGSMKYIILIAYLIFLVVLIGGAIKRDKEKRGQ